MPIYPYACTACGHTFEVQQSFTDASLTQCPECSGKLRKVFSSVGVVFKGSGFYRTDSRSGSVAASSGGEGGSAPAGTSGAGSSGASGSSGTSGSGSTPSSGSSSSGSSSSASAPAAAKSS
ncbi:FmdB family zinc ribbon protein [Cellulomonas aerilata]|uniref:Putative regulatory protein FmdB zinc ribbon domain-containing protein n=1 Tax=Cellulomonas aerilata TaxID=515326 RepID=A0A512DDQ8_9CELL|nr:FmdB family zinc ribbon protein [Cellulomonas aerilata]GEO34606.1 hypothetical protein CAE01nite_23310 [Cellulomonas aerilata]